MSGLGVLNKSPKGVVMGLVQAQLPNVVTPDDLAAQTQSSRPGFRSNGEFYGRVHQS
jgi:predicted phage gp36 major capsid-like protein